MSLAIGISLAFTVVMMVAMPKFIQAVGIDPLVGAAWIGGTIDATGAVAAAGEMLGKSALKMATTVKMIQNILIGVIAFGVSVYWVTFEERGTHSTRVSLWEIWYRLPKFILGFLAASIGFSWLHGSVTGGDLLAESVTRGFTRYLREWMFCLAFVSIGLETIERIDEVPQGREDGDIVHCRANLQPRVVAGNVLVDAESGIPRRPREAERRLNGCRIPDRFKWLRPVSSMRRSIGREK